ncbi:11564_t:CDS:2, partial [Funneliformis mosseae]
PNEDDNDVSNEGNNNPNEDDNGDDNDVSKEDKKEATGLMSALEMGTNRRSMSVLEETISRPVSLDSRANNRNEFLSSKPKSALESRTDKEFFQDRIQTQLGINSQEKVLSRSNSRPLSDVNSQGNDYFVPSISNSRLNSRSPSGVNSQDDDYFAPSKRRTNSPDYYDPSNRAFYSKPMRPSPLGSRANIMNILNNTFDDTPHH